MTDSKSINEKEHYVIVARHTTKLVWGAMRHLSCGIINVQHGSFQPGLGAILMQEGDFFFFILVLTQL